MAFIKRNMTADDWPAVKEIYEQGIAAGNATFENQAADWEHWNREHLSVCRLVCTVNHKLVGWAAPCPVSSRCFYRGVAELSVYVAQDCRGQGVGKMLLQNLIVESEKHGIWTLQAGIFPENITSIELHKKTGFRIVGYREKIGKMENNWRDVVLMERRSKRVGL